MTNEASIQANKRLAITFHPLLDVASTQDLETTTTTRTNQQPTTLHYTHNPTIQQSTMISRLPLVVLWLATLCYILSSTTTTTTTTTTMAFAPATSWNRQRSMVVIPRQQQQQRKETNGRVQTGVRSNKLSRRNMYFADLEETTKDKETATKEQQQQEEEEALDSKNKSEIDNKTNNLSENDKDAPIINTNQQQPQQQQTRILGSQELLMLPRQYAPANSHFPQMTHVCTVLLNATPSEAALRQAIQVVTRQHPLLNARIRGDGEPDRRIDLMNMVRQGEPDPCTFVTTTATNGSTVDDILTIVTHPSVNSKEDLAPHWQATMQRDLDDDTSAWCRKEQGPLWKLIWHKSSTSDDSNSPSALVFSFNHAISDQSSANRLVNQLLSHVAAMEEDNNNQEATTDPSFCHDMPVSVEDSVLGTGQRFGDVGTQGFSLNTLSYVAGKAAEGLKDPVILPDPKEQKNSGNPVLGALSIIMGQTAGGQDETTNQRQTTLEFRTLDKETTSNLLEQCRANGVTMSNALTAAMTLTVTDFIGENDSKHQKKQRNYKVLQSLDMRRFGQQLDQADTVACMAGSHDLLMGPLKDGSGQALRQAPTPRRMDRFWALAKESQQQTQQFVDSNGPEEAVRVFDFAMTISDMNNLVNLAANSKDTQGRAYSAGVTNVGVFERQQGFADKAQGERENLQTKHGRYQIEDVYFATPHVRSGCLFPLSCMTVDGEFKFTFHPMSPVVSPETNKDFANAFLDLLQVVARGEIDQTSPDEPSPAVETVKENALLILTAVVGVAAVLSHAGAYAEFFRSVMDMRQHTDPEFFWPALNFWVFFAVGHPILQPILWISDVLHGTPGPMVGGLVPLLFIAGNVAFISAFTLSKQLRTAVNIAALTAFFSYVGAGLDGTAGLGDFNLALDDSYKGQVVKGCPAYNDVRQTSMDNFDLEKYQGLWYEHKFHDWTQFKEVYDTTLKIALTDGGNGWVDDFAVKGPAPDAAKLSWDKSPVANGAHYFLFGRVDKNDPPGILRESGFGVEFPNYIVDVQKDQSGEYTESIQFQCLERGGVRVFEGINFMSRSPTMTDEQMAAMHARAEKAGMYPYGASPEQMHTVARRPIDAPEIDNNWQAMWRAIGLDKLLELLAESIEDGGR